MKINSEHGSRYQGFVLGHEALHNIGLNHQLHNGIIPYKRGFAVNKEAYKFLPTTKRLKNPDHVMDIVS